MCKAVSLVQCHRGEAIVKIDILNKKRDQGAILNLIPFLLY